MGSLVKRNDHYSSLEIEGGCCVTAYVHGNYMGTSHKYCSDERCIVKQGLNDRISSIKIAASCSKMEINVGFVGTTLSTTESVLSWQNCQWLCKEASNCVGFNYFSSEYSVRGVHQRCTLLSVIDEKVNSIGVISGDGNPCPDYELYSSKTVGRWGNWGPKEYCPWNSYAVGFSLKSQHNQGARDDTALNGIGLFCRGGGSINSATQKWGRWSESKYCQGSKNPIVGFDIQIDTDDRHDETGANLVDMYC